MPYGNSHTGFNARSFSIKWLDEFWIGNEVGGIGRSLC
jgi:hypothetical protein